MKKRNIYHNQSQEILSLFENAGNSTKVMCIPMDYAKKDHVVMFCNGHGDIIRKPFSIKFDMTVFSDFPGSKSTLSI